MGLAETLALRDHDARSVWSKPSSASVSYDPCREPSSIVALSDDVLVHILMLTDDIRQVASLSATSKLFARLCHPDSSLWMFLVARCWPMLPPRYRHVQPHSLVQSRAQFPRWREVCGLMDEIEAMLSPRCGCFNGARLANLVIAAFSSPANAIIGDLCGVISASSLVSAAHYHPIRHNPGHGPAWARQLVTCLLDEHLLRTLRWWGKSLFTELMGRFYDDESGSSIDANLARQAAVIHAMRGASALAFLHDELVIGAAEWAGSQSNEDGSPDDTGSCSSSLALCQSLGERWSSHGLLEVARDLTELLHSLEAEGYNVSVAPPLRPSGVPRTHVWWGAEVPVFLR